MKKYFILVFTLLIFSINLVIAQSSIEFVSPTWSQTITGETSANTIPVTITYTSQVCTTSVCKGIAYIKLLVDDGTNNSITYSTENGGEIPNPLNLSSGEYEFTLYQYEKYLYSGDTLIQLTATDNVKYVDVKFTIKVQTNVGGLIKYYESGSYLSKNSGYEDLVVEDENIAFETPDQEIYGSYYIWKSNAPNISEWKIKKFGEDETNVSYNRRYYHTVEDDDNKAIFTGYLRYDETPPAAPTNLQISEILDEHPVLNWTANTEPDLDGYNLYRKRMGEQSYIKINSSLIITTSYIDTEIDATFDGGTVVDYYITAVDVNDNESSNSNYVSIGESMHKRNSVDDEDALKTYNLSAAYPNPFNPTTTISYQLPKASNVTLIVYDMLGKEVVELVNESKGAGIFNVSFNASNLPSGLYFYKIQADEFTEVRKMLLMK